MPEYYAASFTNLGNIYGIEIKGYFVSDAYKTGDLYLLLHEMSRIEYLHKHPNDTEHNKKVFEFQREIILELLSSEILTEYEKIELVTAHNNDAKTQKISNHISYPPVIQ